MAAPWPPAQPSTHQFQQAAAGFVLPGAVSGQAPMAAAGGFIGTPGSNTAAPQAWAFPTPTGLQLIQHGPSKQIRPYPEGTGPQAPRPAGGAAQPQAPAAGGAHAVRHRLRWETIVPFVAIMCLVALVSLFITHFDAITGSEPSATSSASSRSAQPAIGAAPRLGTALVEAGATPKERIATATRLLRAGSFEEAAATLDPLLAQTTPPPAALRVDARIAASSARNRMLLTRLTRQQAKHDWKGALVTLGQLKRLRPLSAALLADARQARAKLLLAKTRSRARVRAAAPARTAAPSTARSQAAPPSGGELAATPSSRPPSSVPTGSLPPRPDAPNTGGGGGGAVAGGPGTSGSGDMADMPNM